MVPLLCQSVTMPLLDLPHFHIRNT